MKRDLDLIRGIIFKSEEVDANSSNYNDLNFEGYDDDTVVEHALLMYESGLIEASFVKLADGSRQLYAIHRLLSPGHDMLAAIRNDTVWNRTKEKVSSTVGSTTLEIVKGVAEGITKGMLGIS